VLESMQKRGQASPDDGDALALTFAQGSASWFRNAQLPGVFAVSTATVTR
jgi:hypothetical protein